MIPETNSWYTIDYKDPANKQYDYKGAARYTGKEKKIKGETLYLFTDLKADSGFTISGYFTEQDIVGS